MRILDDAYPDEARELYQLYRGAFVKNVALATGVVVMDVSRSQPIDAAAPPAAPPSSATPALPTAPQTTQIPQSPPPAR
jgi:hypothetical protein